MKWNTILPFDAKSPETPANNRINSITLETRVISLHFAADVQYDRCLSEIVSENAQDMPAQKQNVKQNRHSASLKVIRWE